jgi:hypothetical protein
VEDDYQIRREKPQRCKVGKVFDGSIHRATCARARSRRLRQSQPHSARAIIEPRWLIHEENLAFIYFQGITKIDSTSSGQKVDIWIKRSLTLLLASFDVRSSEL